ncbi:MAG: tripartite tricarboxylate transporter substrate binding protein [Clostridiaceae bacterium]|jgi:tripartite-type tricarboxylate transporter receptor subunit TctC|nr:tripartite tricarboxylate transporter substrate binding protein [Clostridiaceae bacterium]
MKNKKIMLIISCILVLTLVFTGCAAKPEAPAAPTGTDGEQTETKELWKPDKAVTLIVPSSAGGGHDNAARVWAKCAEKYAGVQINIVNQAAGAGVVAFTEVMNAKPDGLTLGQASISLVSDQYLVEGATYNQDSFAYIGMNSMDVNNLVVSAKGPYKDMDLKEFIEYAKANPKKIRIGVSGSWTNHDYTRYLLEKTSGAEFTRVSIKGGANIVLGILGGDLDAGVPYPSEIKAQVEAGNLKILGLSGDERSSFWPDVPTFKEQGYDVNLAVWRAIILPKDTPEEILEGWRDIYEKTMSDPETAKEFENVGIAMSHKNAEETKEYIDASHDVYKAIIDSGVVKQ